MTADTTPDSGLQCWRCGQPHRPQDRYCVRCRAELRSDLSATTRIDAGPPPLPPSGWTVPPPRPAPGLPAAPADATTRYLCAAAHLDRSFADTAIREYLV